VTDRPDVTNSSPVEPSGSLQAENGVDWIARHGSNSLDATNTRLRAGVAHCTEFLIDIPSYSGSLNGTEPSGFSDVVLSFKRQLLVPLRFDLSATGGLGFPSGSSSISGHGYQPYIQFPWSHELADGWAVEGMFTLTWYQATRAGIRALSRHLRLVGILAEPRDCSSTMPVTMTIAAMQLLDGGGTWRITQTQQLDFHIGFGLNSSTVDHYFSIGYSIRLDHLWGKSFGNSP
jgi:Putative MetA-pathway of phenol degradation